MPLGSGLNAADAPSMIPPPASEKPAVPTSGPEFPSFGEAVGFWWKLGCISFGGPAGQIAIMHRELVDRRRWIREPHFLHALNFCMLLPGPEAQQLATYLGWRLHGIRGGLAAGGLFVFPSMLLLLGLSWLYLEWGEVFWVRGLFHGLTAAVIAIVSGAVIRMGRRTLKSPALWGLALGAFLAIGVFHLPFVGIIAGAALSGWLGARFWPSQFPSGDRHDDVLGGSAASVVLPPTPAASWGRTGRLLVVGLTLWWLPVLLAGLWLGWESTVFQQGVFFSKAALVTFGGAYAVLPYVAQHAVEHHGWLTQTQMMAGLGLAETTPGPLIMVLQFVGFVGAWQHPGTLPPALAGVLGGLLTTWVTFLPCFLFVFLGGPHVESLQARPRVSAALRGITAAVVGVILNLAVWFTWAALRPASGGWDLMVIGLALAALVALERFKIGVIPVIGGCAVVGLLGRLAGLS